MNREIIAPIRETKIKSLNHFFPDFNSSFVAFAKIFPKKKSRNKEKNSNNQLIVFHNNI